MRLRSMSTRRSVRWSAKRSRVPATATRMSSAITRCSRRSRVRVRFCTVVCGRDRRTPSAARNASSTNSSPAPDATTRSAKLTVRFDSGFWNNDTIANLKRLDVRYTMAIRTNVGAVQTAIAGIDETAWQSIDYTCDGEAQVAECDYTSGQGTKRVTRRLVVRRTRLTGKTQQKLWPDWRHHAFLTDLDGDVDRGRPVPSRTRHRRTRDQGPEGRRRPRTPPVGCVLGELGVVPDRDPRAQHDAAGPPASAVTTPTGSSSPAPSAPDSSPCPAGSSTAPDNQHCGCQSRWPWANTFTTILDALRALEPVPT